jgi:type II secretory ATPase GspE/PulE/Tfp pilus assembly ATPase PilB-like protein
LAQRLVRQICPFCRQPYIPGEPELKRWSVTMEELGSEKLFAGAGCERCMRTGYFERIGIFELLVVSEPIRELILGRAKSSSVKAEALSRGMTTLRADGIAKAREGITTMDEVARVTGRDEF